MHPRLDDLQHSAITIPDQAVAVDGGEDEAAIQPRCWRAGVGASEFVAGGNWHSPCWCALSTLLKVYGVRRCVMSCDDGMKLILHLLHKWGARSREVSHDSCNWQVPSLRTRLQAAQEVFAEWHSLASINCIN